MVVHESWALDERVFLHRGSPRCGVRCVVVSILGVKYDTYRGARDVKELMKEIDDVRKASVVERNTPGP